MADNAIAGNNGSPVTFATDDIGGVHHARSKVGFGVDGSYVDVSASNPLPIAAPADGVPIYMGGGPVDSLNPLPVYLGSAIETSSSYIEDSPHTSGDMGLFILGLREDSDAPTANNGDYTGIKLDEEGRVKVSTKPASYPDIPGNITAIQATIGVPVAGGTVEGDVSRASNVMAFCTGTFAGVNCTFEGSLESSGDNTWFGVQAVRSNANTIELTTGVLGAAPAYAWELSVNGLKRVRVRATARTSGTQSWRFVLGTYATEPIPAAQVSATQPVSGSVTVSGTVTATVAAATLALPTSVADVASAALTTTTTTTAFTPANGCAYTIMIRVTAVTGSTPTLDVMVQESDDAGTNWFDVYQFPRIIATGAYRSPALKLIGNRVRYVQTVTGATPSFTRAIARLQRQCVVDKTAQLFDRTISLTTLNAVTTSLNTMGISNAQLVINLGTASTPPALQLEGSDDNANWYSLGAPLTGVASSTVQLTVVDVCPRFLRARVSTVGVTVVAGYVLIKGF